MRRQGGHMRHGRWVSWEKEGLNTFPDIVALMMLITYIGIPNLLWEGIEDDPLWQRHLATSGDDQYLAKA